MSQFYKEIEFTVNMTENLPCRTFTRKWYSESEWSFTTPKTVAAKIVREGYHYKDGKSNVLYAPNQICTVTWEEDFGGNGG